MTSVGVDDDDDDDDDDDVMMMMMMVWGLMSSEVRRHIRDTISVGSLVSSYLWTVQTLSTRSRDACIFKYKNKDFH